MNIRRIVTCGGIVAIAAAVIVPFTVTAQENLELAGETEAFALRVEYDIPLPAGPGTIPHVLGEIRKTSGENSKGLAAAPSDFGAVVAGDVYDPWSGVNGNDGPLKVGDTDTGIGPPVPPQNNLPTAECFSPGHPSTTVQWPRDIRAETAHLPPTAYAHAECSPGPVTQLTAWAASADSPGSPAWSLAPVVHTGPVSADSLLRPNHGVVESSARATAHGISILEDTIRIGAVEAEGVSTAQGPGGKASTTGHVAITNIVAGGQTFSIANDKLVIGGQSFPISSDPARTILNGINATLDPTGCQLSILGPAGRYPQGYLLGRKPPALGLAKDGTFGASMNGGMLVLCDVPESVSAPTTFSPQRVQILVGFEYTMARATKGVAGFGLGDLGGIIGPPTISHPTGVTHVGGIEVPNVTQPQAPATTVLPPQAVAPSRGLIPYSPLGKGSRLILFLIGIALLLLATNFATRRLRELLGQ